MRDHLITDLAKATTKAAAKKPNRAGQVRRSSGTLLTWDAAELRGSVAWNGTVIRDIPVLGAIDAFSWAAGDEVVVDTIPGTNGGFSSPMILGRVFRPGSANAAKVLQTLQSQLAKEIAAEIFAERIHFDAVTDQESTTSTTFTDLATVGPQISDVNVSSGTAIVFLASGMFNLANLDITPGVEGGFMGVAVSGATTVAPDEVESLHDQVGMGGNVALDVSVSHQMRASNVHVVTGLNPGSHTFTAKYRAALGTGSQPEFFNREMIAIAL